MKGSDADGCRVLLHAGCSDRRGIQALTNMLHCYRLLRAGCRDAA